MNSAVDTLFHPFAKQVLGLPSGGRALFALAQDHPALRESGTQEWRFHAPFYPDARSLIRSGHAAEKTLPPDGGFDTALLAAPRQIDEMKFYIAALLDRLKPGGLLVCSAANDAGGNRLQKFFVEAGLGPDSLSKNKCRVVWARRGETLPELLRDWRAGGELKACPPQGYITAPGLFSWDRIDRGSALLVESLPSDLAGAGADFGCGYGYLTDRVLSGNQDLASWLCIDADARALEACGQNNRLRHPRRSLAYRWDDLTQPEQAPGSLDVIVMNPPFHDRKEESVRIGQGFIRTAFNALAPGGRLWMVANRHLPYEMLLESLFKTCEKVREHDGYKIFHAVK